MAKMAKWESQAVSLLIKTHYIGQSFHCEGGMAMDNPIVKKCAELGLYKFKREERHSWFGRHIKRTLGEVTTKGYEWLKKRNIEKHVRAFWAYYPGAREYVTKDHFGVDTKKVPSVYYEDLSLVWGLQEHSTAWYRKLAGMEV